MRTPLYMLFASVLAACSSSESVVSPSAAPPPTVAPPQVVAESSDPAGPHRIEKTYAPLTLRMTSALRKGQTVVVLQVQADADVPNSHARIVLPSGVALVSGALEQDLGPIAKGQTASLTVEVQVPEQGAFTIAGGVEVTMSAARKLARSVVIELGDAPKAPAPRVIELPEGGKVRLP